MSTLKVDLCVIGGGAGGLSVASAAAQLGVRVALVEAEKMGGDCLNYGCVPSKTLLASAKVAQMCREAENFGLSIANPSVEIKLIMEHVKKVIDRISEHDSVKRFEGLGVHVIQAAAKFVDKNILLAGEALIYAKHFVIATGSSASIPPIPGLDTVSYFTNESIFDLSENPEHLVVNWWGSYWL